MRKPEISEDNKALIRLIAAVFVAIVCVFTFLAILSYCIHWRADMSADVLRNVAGKTGYSFARFLVCRCFGIGSLVLLWFLGALSVKLFREEARISLLPIAVKSLCGAFVLSVLFACLGSLLQCDLAFGGGLGGDCGRYVCALMTGLFGTVVTWCISVFFVLVFLVCSIPQFAKALVSLTKPRPKKPRKLSSSTKALPAVVRDTEPETPAVQVDGPVDEQMGQPAAVEDMPALQPGQEQQTEAAEEESFPEIQITEGEALTTDISKPLPRIDNRLDPSHGGLPNYKFYPLTLLDTYEKRIHDIPEDELNRNKDQICRTLMNYKIEVIGVNAVVGPTVTLYKVTPAPGVKIAQIRNLQEDIGLALGSRGVRVVTLADSVGIEVANDNPSIVPLRGLLNDEVYKENKCELPIALGYAITSQKVKVIDLAQAPHLLVAGATKQGKSVCLNVIISSLLYAMHPSELKFVFIDPKMVEFSAYSALIKHYLAVLPDADDEESEKNRAIVKTAKDAEKVLRSMCEEMDQRYLLLSKAGVAKLTLYNDKFRNRKLNPEHGHRFLPYIVVVVDEYADLTTVTGGSPETKAASRSIMNSILRLAQKGRAAGIHVIIATQRPSVDVITGVIKSNFPMRIAFRTSSQTDSRTIIDAPGAEKLIGYGDMLFSAGIDNERVQCGYIDGAEIEKITKYIESETKYGQCYNTPYYLPEPSAENGGGGNGEVTLGDMDDRFEEAAKLVVTTQNASTSYLQTTMGLGFPKASKIMSQLESAGIVGPQDGARKRQVQVATLDDLEDILKALR